MNYNEMTDLEIAKSVVIAMGGKDMADGVFICENRRYDIGNPKSSFNFDPCNSWADAGPIIVSNLIALKPVSLFVGGHRWFATKGEGDFGLKAADNNPLRAAMIVLLKMQEQPNA